MKKDSDFVDGRYREDSDNLKSAEMYAEDLVDILSLDNEDVEETAWAGTVASPPVQRSPTKGVGTTHNDYDE